MDNILKEQFADLIAEYTRLICREYNEIMSEYLSKLGKPEYEDFLYRYKEDKEKYKISLAIDSMQHFEQIDEEKIEKQADEKFSENEEKLKCMENDLKLAEEFKSLKKLTKSEEKDVKDIVIGIILNIHPDMKLNSTESDNELWNETMEFYKKNDIKELKNILEKSKTASTAPVDESCEYGKEEVDAIFKERIDSYIYKIKEAKKLFPFNKVEFLKDKEKVNARLSELEKFIEIRKEHVIELENKYRFMISASK